MDVIIPSHNLKTLTSSISTLAKIGKILYIEFDPLDGLTIRALNDAKSSFVYFHFEVGFFERCSSSTTSLDALGAGSGSGKKRKKRNRNGDNASTGTSGTHVATTTPRRSRGRRGTLRGRRSSSRKRGRNRSRTIDDDKNEDDSGNQEIEADEKYLCKVPIKTIAAILRPRKGATSLRIRSTSSNSSKRPDISSSNNYDDDDETDDEEMGSHMQLSFEYQIQSNGIMRVLHKVGVSNADAIIAMAPKQHCSEIVTLPKVLLTMLDQVRSTAEVALTVNDSCKKVVASSFHYGDTIQEDNNMVLNASNPAILKTETSIDCNEFEEFHFMDEGAVESVFEDEQKERITSCPPPEGVAEEVTLVFSIKEAKAMLQFCAASQASYVDDEDARVIVSFYWGGRPVIIETEGDAFRGELILATVDHSLLNGISNRYTATTESRSRKSR